MQFEQFLQNYQKNVTPYYQVFFRYWQNQTKYSGTISNKILSRFADLYSRGKQLRGAFSVLGYYLAGGKDKDFILQASIVMELMETSMLIFDDVIDGERSRRGIPTIHNQWTKNKSGKYGNDMAMITSIIGLHLATWQISQLNLNQKALKSVLDFYSQNIIQTGFGEALDISTADSKLIHYYKTVCYTTYLPFHYGAILHQIEATAWLYELNRLSKILGRIFQIQDDIIGSFGQQKQTGKANTSDIKGGRWTMLIELLNDLLDNKDKAVFKKIWQKADRTTEEIEKVKALMIKYQVVDKASQKAGQLGKQAIQLIPKITQDQEYQEILGSLVTYLLDRSK